MFYFIRLALTELVLTCNQHEPESDYPEKLIVFGESTT
jgi:hypothetical protein